LPVKQRSCEASESQSFISINPAFGLFPELFLSTALNLPPKLIVCRRTMVDQTDKTFPTQPEIETTEINTSWAGAIPPKQGLYDPELEKDACGVGFTW